METRPGIYTTEFWVTVLTVLGLVVTSMTDVFPDRYAAIMVGVAAAAYSIARGLAKSGVGADPNVPGNFKLIPSQRDMVRRP